jgi:hypothetical protein
MPFTPASRGRVLVFGILFWYPLAGVTYQFLHYLIGLRRLGYDVHYVEDSGRWVYDPRLDDLSPDADGNVDLVAPVLEAHGFGDRWVFRGNYEGGRCYGRTEGELAELYRTADAFLNVTAAQELREEHLAIPRRIYVESDPFPAQVKAASGDVSTQRMLAAHDVHFTFGEGVGGRGCTLPTAGVDWLPTRQPVATELWRADGPPGEAFTTITTWHNKGKDLDWDGERYYWTKDREFRTVLDLPARSGAAFELAVGDDPDAAAVLDAHGWRRRSSLEISRDPEAYRRYIQGSRGEFTVARDQYVRPRTGWFSDRSACYLAAGRPVITQETGFSDVLPTGTGLFGWTTTDDVLAAVEEIAADPDRHSRGAREVAEEYFAADKVVGDLMGRAGL